MEKDAGKYFSLILQAMLNKEIRGIRIQWYQKRDTKRRISSDIRREIHNLLVVLVPFRIR